MSRRHPQGVCVYMWTRAPEPCERKTGSVSECPCVPEPKRCPGLSYRKLITLVRAARRSREGGKQWVEEEMEVRREDSKWRQAFGEAWLRKERERR